MLKTVLILAGHGGRNRANRGPTGYIEADGVLDIALAAGEALRAAGANVVHDRTTDTDLAPKGVPYNQGADLRARVAVGDRVNADAQIDIHTDAQRPGLRGPMGIYTRYGKFAAESQRLADLVSRGVAEGTGLPLRKPYTRKSESSNDEYYATLRGAKDRRPACIIECACHSDAGDEALLKQADFRRRLGEAIAKAVLEFLGLPATETNRDGPVTIVTGAQILLGRLVEGETWVKLKDLTQALGAQVVSWNAITKTAIVERGDE